MKTVKVSDKEFSLSIKAEDIQKAVADVASKINKELAGKKPLFLAVLNGSFMFASDLFKLINIPCEISFIKLASYQGTKTTENIKTLIGLSENLKDRVVVIIEDIVDTGHTIKDIIKSINEQKPAEVKVCTMLFKPNAYKMNINLDYIGIKIPNDFIIGYGLDYNGFGRNYSDIYKVVS